LGDDPAEKEQKIRLRAQKKKPEQSAENTDPEHEVRSRKELRNLQGGRDAQKQTKKEQKAKRSL